MRGPGKDRVPGRAISYENPVREKPVPPRSTAEASSTETSCKTHRTNIYNDRQLGIKFDENAHHQ